MYNLVVLDYSTQEVHLFKLQSIDISIDEFLRDNGFRESQCSWMFGDIITVREHGNGE